MDKLMRFHLNGFKTSFELQLSKLFDIFKRDHKLFTKAFNTNEDNIIPSTNAKAMIKIFNQYSFNRLMMDIGGRAKTYRQEYSIMQEIINKNNIFDNSYYIEDFMPGMNNVELQMNVLPELNKNIINTSLMGDLLTSFDHLSSYTVEPAKVYDVLTAVTSNRINDPRYIPSALTYCTVGVPDTSLKLEQKVTLIPIVNFSEHELYELFMVDLLLHAISFVDDSEYRYHDFLNEQINGITEKKFIETINEIIDDIADNHVLHFDIEGTYRSYAHNVIKDVETVTKVSVFNSIGLFYGSFTSNGFNGFIEKFIEGNLNNNSIINEAFNEALGIHNDRYSNAHRNVKLFKPVLLDDSNPIDAIIHGAHGFIKVYYSMLLNLLSSQYYNGRVDNISDILKPKKIKSVNTETNSTMKNLLQFIIISGSLTAGYTNKILNFSSIIGSDVIAPELPHGYEKMMKTTDKIVKRVKKDIDDLLVAISFSVSGLKYAKDIKTQYSRANKTMGVNDSRIFGKLVEFFLLVSRKSTSNNVYELFTSTMSDIDRESEIYDNTETVYSGSSKHLKTLSTEIDTWSYNYDASSIDTDDNDIIFGNGVELIILRLLSIQSVQALLTRVNRTLINANDGSGIIGHLKNVQTHGTGTYSHRRTHSGSYLMGEENFDDPIDYLVSSSKNSLEELSNDILIHDIKAFCSEYLEDLELYNSIESSSEIIRDITTRTIKLKLLSITNGDAIIRDTIDTAYSKYSNLVPNLG